MAIVMGPGCAAAGASSFRVAAACNRQPRRGRYETPSLCVSPQSPFPCELRPWFSFRGCCLGLGLCLAPPASGPVCVSRL
jgi:hypothetical protein